VDHPLRGDAELVLEHGVQGLELLPDNTFRPDAPLTRAEAAMIYQDILVRAGRDPSLATRWLGQDSPFPDLRPDHPAFNAAMLCATRGIMEGDQAGGRFRPEDPVHGARALLSIRRLKEELRLF
jgi:hypothetical protein